MSSIDRAKQFLAKRAGKLAMTIVPLAMAVVPASAAIVGLTPGSTASLFGTSSATTTANSCGVQATPDEPAVNPTLNSHSLFGAGYRDERGIRRGVWTDDVFPGFDGRNILGRRIRELQFHVYRERQKTGGGAITGPVSEHQFQAGTLFPW